MYYKYFFKGHNVDNFCPPLFRPIVDFNIAAYDENLRTEQSVPIDTMVHRIFFHEVGKCFSNITQTIVTY